MEIRDATPADARDVQRVSVGSMRAAYGDFLTDETLIKSVDSEDFLCGLQEWLAAIEDDGTVIYLVAVENDEIRGFVQLLYGETGTPEYVGTDGAFLKSLYVLPDHWGEGIGSALLDEATGRLPDDIDRISLAVLEGNERAFEFYCHRGYRRVDTGSYEIGGSSYPTLVLARER